MSKNIVVETARKFANRNGDEAIVVLADGHTARIVPVTASLIDDVSSQYEPPPIPTYFNEEKGREEENPFDPKYAAEVAKRNRERGAAVLDVLVFMGVELSEKVPPDNEWLPKLKYLQKLGRLDLTKFDLDDPMDKEFVYKRWIAVDATVIEQVTLYSGITEEAVKQAQESFQSS